MPPTPSVTPRSTAPRRLPAPFATAPRRAALAAALLLGLPGLLAAAGCDRRPSPPLRPRDLRTDESTYVTRVLVLERLKARLLVEPERGGVWADSLATAWGDSALPRTLDLAPPEPARAERVHDLLLRLLAAEQDSLLRRGGLRPLDAPWPVPADSVSASPVPPSARRHVDG